MTSDRVTYQELYHLRFEKLKAAASDWLAMADKLRKLADGGDGGPSAAGLMRKAKSANWRGDSKKSAGKFLTVVGSEFDDAAVSAGSVGRVLDGVQKELEQLQISLKAEIEAAQKKNIHVNASGEASSAVSVLEAYSQMEIGPSQEGPSALPSHALPLESVSAPQVGSQIAAPSPEDIEATNRRIKALLDKASDAQRAAATALGMHSKDKHDFRSRGFKSFDAAQQAIEDANKLVQIVTQNTGSLTNEQLRHINELLANNAQSPMFAERVITGMKPRDFLEFYGQVSDVQGSMGLKPEDAVKQRMELLGTLEVRLGTTLGDATFSDSSTMDKWMNDAIKLGGQPVGGATVGVRTHFPRVYGFQAMSNLMRHGTYDQQFLVDYGNALVQFEKQNTQKLSEDVHVLPWNDAPMHMRVDQLHFGPGARNDAGLDPMTGFMKALSHNPGAASEFFAQEDPAEYILKERQAFTDVVPEPGRHIAAYDGPTAMWEATGEALFAAASGMGPGDTEAPDMPHTDAQRAVLDNALQYFSAREQGIPPEMRDDMAKVLVNHGSQVYETMSDSDFESPLNKNQLRDVAAAISVDPDSYTLLNKGMTRMSIIDIHTETETPFDSLNRAGHAVGFLEEVRYQVIEEEMRTDVARSKWHQKLIFQGEGMASTLVNLIPGVKLGAAVVDAVDKGTYLVSYQWMQGEINRAAQEAVGDYQDTYMQRSRQLDALAQEWRKVNADWVAEHGDGMFSREQGVHGWINQAANEGNHRAQGIAGNRDDTTGTKIPE